MPVLESEIETKVSKYAIARGCVSIKIVAGSVRGWPDRLFISPSGRYLFIEFKKKGGKLRKLQEHRIGLLKKNNAEVIVIDSIEEGEWEIEHLVTA